VNPRRGYGRVHPTAFDPLWNLSPLPAAVHSRVEERVADCTGIVLVRWVRGNVSARSGSPSTTPIADTVIYEPKREPDRKSNGGKARELVAFARE
jgi:hypothetical protein